MCYAVYGTWAQLLVLSLVCCSGLKTADLVMLGLSIAIVLCCLQDVAVSVVGKYCYHMHSPAEHQTLPVIVDIILVGRTKIITLHSSIWLINSTDKHVAFRLHVPITPLVAPARVGPPNRKQRTTDHVIGPLEPNAGI